MNVMPGSIFTNASIRDSLRRMSFRTSFTACVSACVSLLLASSAARANPEPPAMYDAQALGTGGAGLASLDTPGAIVHNPANLAALDRGQFELSLTTMLVRLEASFAGEGNEQRQLIPVPLFFLGGSAPVSQRLTLGGAVYIAMGFGGRFGNVRQYGTGTPCISSFGDVFDFSNIFGGEIVREEARNADYCPSEPRDEKVTLVILEAAVPVSVRVSRRLRIGAAIRFPYGLLRQQTSQDIFGALSDPMSPQGNFGLGYAQATSSMKGLGTPGVLLGATFDVLDNVSLAVSYRSRTRISLEGTTTLDLRSNELIGSLLGAAGGLDAGTLINLLGLELPGLEVMNGDTVDEIVDRISSDIPSKASWYMPHALELGVAWRVLDRRLLLAADFRMQFHKSANRALTIHLDSETIGALGLSTMTQRFDWRNVFGGQVGAEYSVTDDVNVRLGASMANSATPRATTTQFGVPPGLQYAVYAGGGMRLGSFLLDLGFSYGAVTPYRIRQRYDENDAMVYEPTCQPGQVIKTGCPGRYSVASWFLGLGMTYRPRAEDPVASTVRTEPARAPTRPPATAPASTTRPRRGGRRR